MIEPTDEMLAAFLAAWDDENRVINESPAEYFEANARDRAGLAAVLAIVERDQGAGWLIWSRYHRAWWGPDERGYTSDTMGAGRYDREHAERLAGIRKMDDGTPGEVVVKAPEIGLIGTPDFTVTMRRRIQDSGYAP